MFNERAHRMLEIAAGIDDSGYSFNLLFEVLSSDDPPPTLDDAKEAILTLEESWLRRRQVELRYKLQQAERVGDATKTDGIIAEKIKVDRRLREI